MLFAGLLAEGDTTVVEPLATRDHTSGCARGGCAGHPHPGAVSSAGPGAAAGRNEVPGDISSAAFFIVAPPWCRVALFLRGVGSTRAAPGC